MLHFLLLLLQSLQDLISTCSKLAIFLWFMIPIPPKCPVREGCNVPMLRKPELREGSLDNISWLMCDCRTPSSKPVLSGPCSFHYIILPALSLQWEIIGLSENISASGNQRKKDKEISGTADPWTTPVWTVQAHSYMALKKTNTVNVCSLPYDFNHVFL